MLIIQHDYSATEYLEYADGVSDGLRATERRTHPTMKLSLRGPAGLFKAHAKHPLCWGLLNQCNINMSHCPIDVITFHRKGINGSDDILPETIALLKIIHETFPNLKDIPYANTEADPTSGWSKNVTSYADVHYAHALVSIVFQHWNAFLNGPLKSLDSISHDNSFLSYHPFEFEQRTMLARFAINTTRPKSVVFIQKPVYAALGMLSALAIAASQVRTEKNISYILSVGEKYAAVLLASCKNSDCRAQRVQIQLNFIGNEWTNSSDVTYGYIAEYLDQQRTNPYSVWLRYGRPAYPNATVSNEMMHAQVRFSIKLWKINFQLQNQSISNPIQRDRTF